MILNQIHEKKLQVSWRGQMIGDRASAYHEQEQQENKEDKTSLQEAVSQGQGRDRTCGTLCHSHHREAFLAHCRCVHISHKPFIHTCHHMNLCNSLMWDSPCKSFKLLLITASWLMCSWWAAIVPPWAADSHTLHLLPSPKLHDLHHLFLQLITLQSEPSIISLLQ
jgi:hypothetical protein